MWLVGLMLVPSVMAERKKVGLVLGGGGAKGVAHIWGVEGIGGGRHPD